MADEIAVLPTRPSFPCVKRNGRWWLDETSVYDHMDAQDDRIKELEGDAESTAKRLGDMQLESIRQANKITGLEREIREAHELLTNGSKWATKPRSNYGKTMRAKTNDWLARNAEKEQAS